MLTCSPHTRGRAEQQRNKYGPSRYFTNSYDELRVETQGDGSVTTRSYDLAGRLVDITGRRATSSPFQSEAYVYDASGNLRQRTRGTATETFGHDHLNRLVASSAWSNPVQYDKIGNIEATPMHASYVYESGYVHRPHFIDNTEYVYDLGGNRVQSIQDGGEPEEETRIAEYTRFNKPRAFGMLVNDEAVVTSTIRYDADEQRVVKQTPEGTTVYVGGLYEKRCNSSPCPVVT